jgi:hypothetical protein
MRRAGRQASGAGTCTLECCTARRGEMHLPCCSCRLRLCRRAARERRARGRRRPVARRGEQSLVRAGPQQAASICGCGIQRCRRQKLARLVRVCSAPAHDDRPLRAPAKRQKVQVQRGCAGEGQADVESEPAVRGSMRAARGRSRSAARAQGVMLRQPISPACCWLCFRALLPAGFGICADAASRPR